MNDPLLNEFQPTEATEKSPHVILALCSILVTIFAIWAAVSELDIVSMTTGEVAPVSQVKTVQHLEGGIVREILVQDGDTVTVGQQLVIMEPTASEADVSELQVRLTALKGDISRFDALYKGFDKPIYGEDLIQASPRIVEQSEQRFHSQMKRHRSNIAKQQQTIHHRTLEIQEIEGRIKSSKASLKLAREQVGISNELMSENLTNRMNHLDLLKEFTNLQGNLDNDKQGLATAHASLKEAQAEMVSLEDAFSEINQEALDDARRSYDELYERIKKYADSLKRTIVRSPVDGVIKVLYVATIGGVVRPGDAIADIVPGADRLIVDAQLPTTDIGYIQVGQKAVVKLASADAARFGNLDGIVSTISPDTLETPEGEPYYKVRIKTEQAYFERGSLRYNLFPGMQVMVSIQTGTRTVLQYLFDPLTGNMSSAMQER